MPTETSIFPWSVVPYTRRRSLDFSVLLLKKDPGGLSLRQDGCRTKIGSSLSKTQRLDVLTFYYVNTTRFGDSNTVQRCRRYPIPVSQTTSVAGRHENASPDTSGSGPDCPRPWGSIYETSSETVS